MSNLIATNESGENLGPISKEEAHAGNGVLHRAFSIFIFREDSGELLLHKRASNKRFADFWTNTCCSHPLQDEDLLSTAKRRLQEEMGFSAELQECSSFVYQAVDPKSGESEYEYDTVLVGHVSNANIAPDPEEVSEWKWVPVDEIQKDLQENPEKYSPWFGQALQIAVEC